MSKRSKYVSFDEFYNCFQNRRLLYSRESYLVVPSHQLFLINFILQIVYNEYKKPFGDKTKEYKAFGIYKDRIVKLVGKKFSDKFNSLIEEGLSLEETINKMPKDMRGLSRYAIRLQMKRGKSKDFKFIPDARIRTAIFVMINAFFNVKARFDSNLRLEQGKRLKKKRPHFLSFTEYGLLYCKLKFDGIDPPQSSVNGIKAKSTTRPPQPHTIANTDMEKNQLENKQIGIRNDATQPI